MSINVEDYYNFRFMKASDVSPDGKKLVYTLTKYVDSNEGFHKKEEMQLWILDRDTNEEFQLTHGTMDYNPKFSPDGKYIAFNSQRGEFPQLFILPMTGGDAKQLTFNPLGVSAAAEWSPDGKIIATSISRNTDKIDHNKPYRITRDFYHMDAIGIVENVLTELVLINVESGDQTIITDDLFMNIDPQWRSDGKKILYHAMFDPKSTMGIYPKIRIIDIKTKEITMVAEEYNKFASAWFGELIVFAGVLDEKIIGSRSELILYNPEKSECTILTEGHNWGVLGGLQMDLPSYEARLPILLVHSNMVYVSVQRGGTIQIDAISKDSRKTIISGESANYPLKLINNEIFYTSINPHNPCDIFTLSLSSGDSTQLTFTNRDFLSTKTLPIVKRLQFKGKDGMDVEGWIYLPHEESKNLPSLLNIHGGPHAGWGYGFIFENLYLNSLGYAIILVNQRGSTGYGDEFSTMLIGDWGNHDYHDLIAGVDFAIEEGYTNPDKLGVFGISGGGNLSSWIVGQTNRFKAAIPENPVTNWQSFFGVSDIGRWFATKEMGGKPYEIPEVYFKSSPINYAHNCTTPTLMIQHMMDYRCPPEQSDQFYAILKEVGCTVEMLRMPPTPHSGSGIGPLEIRETQNLAIIDWFDRFILS